MKNRATSKTVIGILIALLAIALVVTAAFVLVPVISDDDPAPIDYASVPFVVLYVLAGLLVAVVIVEIVLAVRNKKGGKPEAETVAEAPAAETAAEETESETSEPQAAAEDARGEQAEEPISLRESIAVARHTAHSVNWSKKAIADDLRARHAGEIEVNERVSRTTTGLPLADTHYAVDDKTKKCFVYVYETEGSPLLLINADADLASRLGKRHGNVHKSAFPKSKTQWYSLPLDDTYSKEEVQSVLDRCHAYVLGRDVNAIPLADSVSPKPAGAEEPISLRESIAVARHTAHSMNWSKKAIADDLRARHGNEVEVNERVSRTTTGLPLADTHYAVDDKTKKCFVYVYETEGAPMLLINSDEELAAELNARHGNVHKSAFPKSKDQWYSLPLDDTYSKEEVQSVLDRCHAHVLGRDAKAIALRESLPDPVSVVSANEVNDLISDEAAEAAIEEEYTGRATGKKEIVNVDSLSVNFNAGDTVTLQALKEKGLVPKNAAQVKLLAHGTLDKVLHVELQDYSLDAVKMVLATGGTVKHVAPPERKK